MQDGSADLDDNAYAAATTPDGGFVLAGSTWGSWGTAAYGDEDDDFVVAKIDSDGELVWIWQV